MDCAVQYGWEWGAFPDLAITPLTTRMYMTLTASFHFGHGTLMLGPPGTGKTETMKEKKHIEMKMAKEQTLAVMIESAEPQIAVEEYYGQVQMETVI